ncbi:hemin uptake protein HemP [Oxalobacteraceae bacterium R-40]|uniref:Hemin uptake protein HemP n=1 Tax=Keguizhuia sedimenti TaxID=3064264 RepID=A0ABU1BIQ1_9BURK|nr:hemin uptake protein HemP [Oxalobacteraceae bacterium R-40]
MNRLPSQDPSAGEAACGASEPVAPSLSRIKSQDLFKQMREVEIDHEGRIYRLRLTQLNKLILTA